jgi:hypothetical protein
LDEYQREHAIFAYLVYKLYILNKKKQYWMHPFTDSRLIRGRFSTSFGDLRENPDMFLTISE